MMEKKNYKRYWHELSKIRGERDLCIISHVLHHYQIYFSNSLQGLDAASSVTIQQSQAKGAAQSFPDILPVPA